MWRESRRKEYHFKIREYHFVGLYQEYHFKILIILYGTMFWNEYRNNYGTRTFANLSDDTHNTQHPNAHYTVYYYGFELFIDPLLVK